MSEFTHVFALRQLMSPLKEGASVNFDILRIGELPDINDFDEIANDHMELFDSIYSLYLRGRRRQ